MGLKFQPVEDLEKREEGFPKTQITEGQLTKGQVLRVETKMRFRDVGGQEFIPESYT